MRRRCPIRLGRSEDRHPRPEVRVGPIATVCGSHRCRAVHAGQMRRLQNSCACHGPALPTRCGSRTHAGCSASRDGDATSALTPQEPTFLRSAVVPLHQKIFN